MPTLKQVTCSVILDGPDKALSEYRTRFSDGAVETYIAAPDVDSNFHIHIRADGYIAPGLAAFVYIDGIYQCNRNRPAATSHRQSLDLWLRQKEDCTHGGDFVGRAWSFAKLRIGQLTLYVRKGDRRHC